MVQYRNYTNVRIVAKRNTIPFYVSNALKVVNGKTPQNREIDLNEYSLTVHTNLNY